MRLPIQYAIGYPDRIQSDFPRLDFFALPNGLTFEKPDLNVFRNLAIAIDSARKGGNIPCAMNAANEVAVKEFLHDQIGFVEMSSLIEYTLGKISYVSSPSIDDIVCTHEEATKIALEYKTCKVY